MISMKLSTQERAILLLFTYRIVVCILKKGAKKKSWGEVFTFHLIIALFWFSLCMYSSVPCLVLWVFRDILSEIRCMRELYYLYQLQYSIRFGDICLSFLIYIARFVFILKFWDKIVCFAHVLYLIWVAHVVVVGGVF